MKNKSHKTMKKSLGQNFLRDNEVIEEIIDIAALTSSDTVIEVGPGDGALTAALLETGAQVIAIELDDDLIIPLKEKFSDKENFFLVHEDIRKYNLTNLLSERNIDSYKVVANLPYYITSSIIRYFLECQQKPQTMTVMVQKEVAQRICALPGKLSILGVSVQFYGDPSIQITVPAEAFEPSPKVDSAVLHIQSIGKKNTSTDEKAFFRIVRAGFSARRKMLAKNLSASFSLERGKVVKLLSDSDIAETVRPQELSIEQWENLRSSFEQEGY